MNPDDMTYKFTIRETAGEPVYKQLIHQFETSIKVGKIKAGEIVPSMNELAAELGISRETVKKSYTILRDRGYLESRQGKGFYVKDREKSDKINALILFDKLSIYKQTLLNSFIDKVGENVEFTILLHNQNLDLYEYYLDLNLDMYDYYLVTLHFPRDKESHKRMVRLTSRIPNRKLIILDNLPSGLKGNFGAVYQDFENDAYYGLMQGADKIREHGRLKVITMPTSLYGKEIKNAVERFCKENEIRLSFYNEPPKVIEKDDIFLMLNSQLDSGIADLASNIEENGLVVGKDVFIISYNEFPLNKVVLGGLTTISTDFTAMGELAAKMIVEKQMSKQKCRFNMIRRKTF